MRQTIFSMKNQVQHWDQKNKDFLKVVILFLELVWLNVYTLCYFEFMGNPFSNEAQRGIWLAINAAYVVSSMWVNPIVIHRRITMAEIVQSSMRTFLAVMVISLLLIAFLDHGIVAHYKRIPFYYLLLMLLLIFERTMLRQFMRWYRSRSKVKRNVVFFGVSDATSEIIETIRRDEAFGYHVIGYFDDQPNSEQMGKYEYLGTFEQARERLAEYPEYVAEAFCCLSSNQSTRIAQIAELCDDMVINFNLVPNFWNYLHRTMYLSFYGETPLLHTRYIPLSSFSKRMLKRTFDIIVSFIFLVFFFPFIFIIVATIIKITMPGPIFFKQKRSGLRGDTFVCYKFRSMKVNKEADIMQATKEDPRKTPFGNFMRHTNIDELPQFWNVLIGNMSVVGPRPHMLRHTEEYSKLVPKYMVRHFAKPGITGWAQVNGCRGETKELWQMEDRVKHDIWYIENWTFFLDLRIIWLTVFNTIRGEKAAY